MEKSCDLCLGPRPVVRCKADSANLCLSCDAKVHSANRIVHRHHRILLCDSCKYRKADVECLDHGMFMCHVCDRSLHRFSSRGQHQKRTMISSYTGCPSAKDFATYWGFKLNENISSTTCAEFISTCVEFGSSSQTFDEISDQGQGGQCEKKSFILDQIIDLKRLQLSEWNDHDDQDEQISDHDEKSSSVHPNRSKSLQDDLDYQQLQQSENDLGTTGSQQTETKVDTLPFPSSSCNVGFPSYTESVWQGRNRMQNSQLWCQNMQDLGACEELGYHQDSNTPDVDMTFRNFEESFGSDQNVVHTPSRPRTNHPSPHARATKK